MTKYEEERFEELKEKYDLIRFGRAEMGDVTLTHQYTINTMSNSGYFEDEDEKNNFDMFVG